MTDMSPLILTVPVTLTLTVTLTVTLTLALTPTHLEGGDRSAAEGSRSKKQ